MMNQCPHCGRCPHCGQPQPPSYWQLPWSPQPYWYWSGTPVLPSTTVGPASIGTGTNTTTTISPPFSLT